MGNIESAVHSPEDYVNYHVSHGEHSSCLSKLHLSHHHQEQQCFQMSQQHPAHITDNFSSLDKVLNLTMKFVEVICLLMYHPWYELYTMYKCLELYLCASFINYNEAKVFHCEILFISFRVYALCRTNLISYRIYHVNLYMSAIVIIDVSRYVRI